MHSVFIADDEIWIILGLKKMIENSELPFQVIGNATNGVSALDAIEEKNRNWSFLTYACRDSVAWNFCKN